jgi:hypothetical protein
MYIMHAARSRIAYIYMRTLYARARYAIYRYAIRARARQRVTRARHAVLVFYFTRSYYVLFGYGILCELDTKVCSMS